MNRRARLLTLFVSVLAMVGVLAPAGAAPPDHSAADEHRRIVSYWTAERVASAVPMQMVVDPVTGDAKRQAKPDGTGNGNGNGGGGGGCHPRKGCAPTVTITSPGDGSTVSGTVTISGSAADSDGTVQSVSVTAAGTTLPVSGTSSWTASWDTTAAADGSQQITATATDDAGRSTSTSITVTVANGSSGGSDPEPIVGGDPWIGDADGNARQTVGKVLFTMSGTNYVCSASLVDSNLDDSSRPPLVLTAGHCVHDGDGATFATNWTFMPDFETDKTYGCGDNLGCWTGEALVTTSRWANSGDFERDAAFVRLRDGGLNGSTPITSVIDMSQGIRFSSSLGDYQTSFGYPHASPYDGTKLIHCANTTDPDPFGSATQGMTCDMTGGSSGGPWLSDLDRYGSEIGYATGLNSYKYTRIWADGKMYGPIFGSWTQNLYNTALTASGNTVVG